VWSHAVKLYQLRHSLGLTRTSCNVVQWLEDTNLVGTCPDGAFLMFIALLQTARLWRSHVRGQNNDPWSKAGVMIRQGAATAMLVHDPLANSELINRQHRYNQIILSPGHGNNRNCHSTPQARRELLDRSVPYTGTTPASPPRTG